MAKIDPVKNVQEANPLYFILIYLLTVVAPSTALIIAAFCILGIYWDEPCGNKMSLQVWLLVYAIVASVYLLQSALAVYHRKTRFGAVTYVYSASVYWLFTIIWNIYGAVDLFGSDCQTILYPIYAMTLTILILQWIVFSCYACMCCCLCCRV